MKEGSGAGGVSRDTSGGRKRSGRSDTEAYRLGILSDDGKVVGRRIRKFGEIVFVISAFESFGLKHTGGIAFGVKNIDIAFGIREIRTAECPRRKVSVKRANNIHETIEDAVVKLRLGTILQIFHFGIVACSTRNKAGGFIKIGLDIASLLSSGLNLADGVASVGAGLENMIFTKDWCLGRGRRNVRGKRIS